MSIIQEALIWKVMICTGIGIIGFIIFGCSTFFRKIWRKIRNIMGETK
ncbi:hypothetical protein AA0X95_22815 [Bacillus sp. 1P10SD]